MLSQFVSEIPGLLLGELGFDFPPGIHAIGRLDKDSEGLLLLTTNKKVTRLLFQGDISHSRTYRVKVNHRVSDQTLATLREGISIRVKGGEYYTSKPCSAELSHLPEGFTESISAIPAFVLSSWLEIILTEGKYHQVRKMVRAVHHRCRRLIRTAIEDLHLDGLPAGETREIPEAHFFHALKLDRGSAGK